MLLYVLCFLAGVVSCAAYPKVRNLIKPSADSGKLPPPSVTPQGGGPGQTPPPPEGEGP